MLARLLAPKKAEATWAISLHHSCGFRLQSEDQAAPCYFFSNLLKAEATWENRRYDVRSSDANRSARTL
jgi:hypothetical protein